MTTLIGRAAACLATGKLDPKRLGSAIATHAHCAQRAPDLEVNEVHNGVNGTSAGNAVGALSVSKMLWALL